MPDHWQPATKTAQMGCTASTVAAEPLSTDRVKGLLDPNETLVALRVMKDVIEKGQVTDDKTIQDMLAFLLKQLEDQHAQDKRRQGNLRQNKLSEDHPIIQMMLLITGLQRPQGTRLNDQEILLRLSSIIQKMEQDRAFPAPMASPCPEQARIPIDRRPMEVKADDVDEILDWILNPKEKDSMETEPFKRVDELLPKKPGQTPEERANDIDNTLVWLQYRGVDEPNMSMPDMRTPEQKAISQWARDPREHDSADTVPFNYIDHFLPKKQGQSQEDRAQDIDNALTWVRNRGIDEYAECHIKQVATAGKEVKRVGKSVAKKKKGKKNKPADTCEGEEVSKAKKKKVKKKAVGTGHADEESKAKKKNATKEHSLSKNSVSGNENGCDNVKKISKKKKRKVVDDAGASAEP